MSIQAVQDSEVADPFTLRYKVLGEIGEGSYSKVLKCRRRDTGDIFACKRLKHAYKNWGQVAEIPEIVTLRKLVKHPNILQMSEIHFDPSHGRVSLVFELMDMNLYELIKDRKRLLQENRVRNMIFQLIRGLRHLHKHGIFHRDVKPENILLKRTPNEEEEILKLGDLGSVRGLYSRPPYTEYISTRWYRSPECLLTAGYYSIKMDIWATGCVFYEVLTLRPLFPGSSEVDQVNRIHNIIGPPPAKILQKFVKHVEDSHSQYQQRHQKQARLDNIKTTLSDLRNGNGKGNFEWYFSGKEGGSGVERLLPNHISAEARELLGALLQYDPELRPTAHRALSHPYFKGLREAARNSVADVVPGEVVVSIGTSVQTLAEVDGQLPDLRTLGDMRPKRLPREVPSKIPILLKQQAPPPVALSSDPSLNNNSINNYNLNNVNEVIPIKQESKGKKVNTYDEFTQKSNASLPYEIVHIDKRQRPHIDEFRTETKVRTPPSTGSLQGSNQVQSNTLAEERERERIKEVYGRRTKQTSSTTKFTRELVDRNMLSPGTLRRINENRRLVQLEPIESRGKQHNSKEYFNPVFKQKSSDRLGKTILAEKQPSYRTGQKMVRNHNAYEYKGYNELPPQPHQYKVYDQIPLSRTREDIRENPPQAMRKSSYQLQQQKKNQESASRLPKQKSLQRQDFQNQNYQMRENMTPPVVSQVSMANSNPSSHGLSYPHHQTKSKRRIQKKENYTLLDYQEFSARYKSPSRQTRRRREETIPSDSSSDAQVLPDKASPRRRPQRGRQWAQGVGPKEDRRALEEKDSYVKHFREQRDRYKMMAKENNPHNNGRKMQRFNEYLNNGIFPIRKSLATEVEMPKASEDDSDDLFVSTSQHKKLNFQPSGMGRVVGRGSEGVLPRLKVASNEGNLFTSNSYYPSLQGRIRVSKPSLQLRTPVSSLHQPPLIRQSEKTPFTLNPRPSQKFQRETVTKKKYSFLHEKQDFLYSKKSKLG